MKSAAGEIVLRLNRALPSMLSRAMLNFAGSVECDFVTDVLKPWCIAVAACSIGHTENVRFGVLADRIFAASAFPRDSGLQNAGRFAIAELQECVGSENVIAVQTFVALATSLPAFIATAWALLLSHPDEWRTLQQEPKLIPLAIEECLRLAGLPCIQFRQAACDVVLGTVEIKRNQSVLLRIQLANQDPAVFSNPNSFKITRTNNLHLSFGRGGHSCIGAHVVRSIGQALMNYLLSIVSAAELREPPHWKGCAMRYLETLPVRVEMRRQRFV